MKLGVKLFPGSVVALLLGVFLAAPLLYASIVMAPGTKSDGSELFGVEIAYAYLERQNTTTLYIDEYSDDYVNGSTTIELDEPTVRSIVVLNVTRHSAIITPCVAEFWVYQVEFYTDKSSISNVTCYRGIISNSSLLRTSNASMFSSMLGQIMSFSSQFIDIYGGENGGGGTSAEWPIGHSAVLFLPAGGSDWVSAVDESEAIFVRVKELGWAVYGDSTEVVVLPEPEVIAEVQLEKYKDGFMYNAAITEDRLLEIELLNPAPWDFFD